MVMGSLLLAMMRKFDAASPVNPSSGKQEHFDRHMLIVEWRP